MSQDTGKKYALRQNGVHYGAHLTEAFKARAQKMSETMTPEDKALAARFGYWLAELTVR
jgi:hypothetical protein